MIPRCQEKYNWRLFCHLALMAFQQSFGIKILNILKALIGNNIVLVQSIIMNHCGRNYCPLCTNVLLYCVKVLFCGV